MEKNTKDMLEELEEFRDSYSFSHFFKVANKFLDQYPAYPELKDEAERLSADYDLLFNCYMSGVDDPKRVYILQSLAKPTKRLYRNFCFVEKIEQHSFLQAARKRAAQVDLLRVAEMLPEKKGDLEWYNAVFSAVLVSWQWDERTAQEFCDLLSDPDTDPTFVRLMISAILLSCNCALDLTKVQCLVDICMKVQNVLVRQYAEVALVFGTASCDEDRFSDVMSAIEPLVNVPEYCEEFQELQKQIIICMDAEKDSVQVDKELISSLPKARVPKFVRNDELEDTPIDEILHPEEEEDASEKLEASVRKMLAMQEQGSDIYYNGFSKMKNFPFFRRLSNWFLPFSVENPLLKPLVDALDGDTRMLKSLSQSYTFCQSDKYSFAFAVEASLKRELASLKSFIKEGMMFGGEPEALDQTMFVRRMYLQDLYRFFKVSPFKDAFSNPFEKVEQEDKEEQMDHDYSSLYDYLGGHYSDDEDDEDDEQTGGMFLKAWANEYFDELKPALQNVCRFLYKRKDYDGVITFADVVVTEDFEDEEMLWYLIQAAAHENEYEYAMSLTFRLRKPLQNTLQCIRLRAKCELMLGDYNRALADYTKAQEMKPSLSNQIKIAYCHLMSDEVEDAMSLLFELDYKHPNNPDVMRSLAWGHLQRQNVDAALALYQKLQKMFKMDSPEFDPEDIYNEGLCNWFLKDRKKASVAFHEYMEISGIDMEGFSYKLHTDIRLLDMYHISIWDSALMKDSIHIED